MRDRWIGTRLGAILFAAILFFTLAMAMACSKKEPPARSPKTENSGRSQREEGVVRLLPEVLSSAGIEAHKIVLQDPSELINATAVLEVNGDRISRVGARVTGRCVKVGGSLGDRVKAGQVLAQIDSIEMDQAWSDYLKAKGRLGLASSSVKREETLFRKKVSPEKDLLKARQDFSEAEAEMLLAKERFRLLGVDEQRVERDTTGTSHRHPMIPVYTPLSGIIIEKTVTEGEMIGPEKTLFVVADLSSLWLMIDIYERDLGRVKTGMVVRLAVSSYPGREFSGRISYMGDVMDDKTRMVRARVTIDNKDGALKPGMFATASINSIRDSKAGKVILLPEESVFLDGSDRYVFLDEGNGRFIVRRVLVGPASGRKIEIKEGLKTGDAVVTKGVFTLKSELKKEVLQAE